MDKELNKILKLFVEKSAAAVNPKEIYLYGSYAKGSQSNDSDIDIAVITQELNSNHFENYTRLYSIVSNIDVRLEPVYLAESNDKSGFIDHIKSYGKRLYP